MKKKNQKIFSLVILLVSLLFITTNHTNEWKLGELPLSTAITHLEYSSIDSTYLNENYSNFEFTIDFQIANPNSENVILEFTTTGNNFLGNMTATINNKHSEIFNYDPGCFGACWTFNISPGIVNKTITYRIGLTQQGLEELPDGKYILWVEISPFDERIYIANQTLLIIKDGNTYIYYNQLISMKLNPSLIYFLISGVIIINFNMIYKKNKSKK